MESEDRFFFQLGSSKILAQEDEECEVRFSAESLSS